MDIRKYKGIIFDLDGTLLDSMGVWNDVDIEFFKRRNIPLTDEYKEKIKSMHFDTAAKYTKETYNLPESEKEIIDEWLELCEEAYSTTVMLKDGAKEFIKYCKECGLKLTIATASTDKISEAVLRNNGVREYFDAKTYVEEVGKDKHEPDVYLLAARKLGLEPKECIVCEDILIGLKSAKKVGFTTVAMYDEDSKDEWEEICETSDINIHSFAVLM